jgi:pimeloyl-ACP methyl ester carboxylesterase
MAGSGPAVVLLHGWPQTSHAWRHVIADLCRDHLVVAPDLRGFGASSCPPTGYDKRTLGNDIARLLDRLGIASAAIVGHDWGSLVGYSLAQDHPGLASRLVMIEIGVLDDGFYALPLRFVADHIWHMPFHMVPELPELLVAGRVRHYLGWFFATAHRREAFTEADIDEYVRCYDDPARLQAGFELYRAIGQDIADQKARAGRTLQMPVLALGGEFSNGEAVGRSLEEIAGNLTVGVIAGAGHWIPEEQPDDLVRRLRAFLPA